MNTPDRIEFSDHRGMAVPVRVFYGRGIGAALILPGLGYTGDMPLLTALRDMLLDQVAQICVVDYDYRAVPEFMDASDADQLSWLYADGAAYLGSAERLLGAAPRIIGGKSLGTICMGGMAGLDPATRMIWLTPSVVDTGLADRMAGMDHAHFSLLGSRDPAAEFCRWPGYAGARGMTHVELDGMNHAWDHEQGDAAAAAATRVALDRISAWLDI